MRQTTAFDPKQKYTTDGYRVIYSNDGTIGIPLDVKERTFTAALAPYGSAEAGI
ncbi:MAG: hypothetical protein OEV08_14210 [Nitrospira sp.]|nr:hypothetical protein [Nitrospira sp.]